MHSCKFPDGDGVFHYNSDFSGDVHVYLKDPQAKWEDVSAEFRIPGKALQTLMWQMIESKLGDIRGDITEAIMDRIATMQPPQADKSKHFFCGKCGTMLSEKGATCTGCGRAVHPEKDH